MIWTLSLGKFYGIDSIIDFLILFIAGVISYQSYKIYRILGEKNYQYFSWAFLSICVSYIFKIISNLTLTYRVIVERPNFVVLVLREFEQMQLINFASFIFYKIFIVIGFITMLLVTTKHRKLEHSFLFLYFGLITVILSIYFNFIFFITQTIILAFLTMYFNKNYKAKQTKSSLLVTLGFLSMLAGSLFSIFYDFYHLFYILSEILFLVGFLILLANHVNIKNKIPGYRDFRLNIVKKESAKNE